MSAPQLKAQSLPLYKVLLHSAKYPDRSICGILLGSVDDGNVTITEAIPLFHITSALAAPVEMALAQMDAYVAASEGKLTMVGYYEAGAYMQAAELSPVGRRISDRIADKYPSSIALLLDPLKLQSCLMPKKGADCSPPFVFLTRHATTGAWKQAPAADLALTGGPAAWTKLLETLKAALSKQQQCLIYDFDEHLDDLSKDYMNPHIVLPLA
eukprot:gene25948-11628_t